MTAECGAKFLGVRGVVFLVRKGCLIHFSMCKVTLNRAYCSTEGQARIRASEHLGDFAKFLPTSETLRCISSIYNNLRPAHFRIYKHLGPLHLLRCCFVLRSHLPICQGMQTPRLHSQRGTGGDVDVVILEK